MTPMLRLSGVEKDYGKVRALNGIDLEVAPGEVIAIVGPSGCGKSTLLRCLNGLEEITGGQIELDGTVITGPGTGWTEVRQRVGMVFQSYELFPHLNVLDNLLLGPRLVQKRNQDQAGEEALRLLTRVGLAEKAKALPRELSGGQKQRVAVAGVVALRPDIIILDEATSMLDPEGRLDLIQTVKKIKDGNQLTVISITHDLDEIALSDRVLVMKEGQVESTATPRELFSREDLEELGLDQPFVNQVKAALRQSGLPLPDSYLTEKELQDQLWVLLSKM